MNVAVECRCVLLKNRIMTQDGEESDIEKNQGPQKQSEILRKKVGENTSERTFHFVEILSMRNGWVKTALIACFMRTLNWKRSDELRSHDDNEVKGARQFIPVRSTNETWSGRRGVSLDLTWYRPSEPTMTSFVSTDVVFKICRTKASRCRREGANCSLQTGHLKSTARVLPKASRRALLSSWTCSERARGGHWNRKWTTLQARLSSMVITTLAW